MLCCSSAVPQSAFEFSHLLEQLPEIQLTNILNITVAEGQRTLQIYWATNISEYAAHLKGTITKAYLSKISFGQKGTCPRKNFFPNTKLHLHIEVDFIIQRRIRYYFLPLEQKLSYRSCLSETQFVVLFLETFLQAW